MQYRVNLEKIEILLYTNKTDKTITSKVTFDNISLIITGSHLIIETYDTTSQDEKIIETGNVFNLNEIKSYRTYKIK